MYVDITEMSKAVRRRRQHRRSDGEKREVEGMGNTKLKILLQLCNSSMGVGVVVGNYSGAPAISHPESRPDTAASIIHMTTVNEQDPNKSPLNSLGGN